MWDQMNVSAALSHPFSLTHPLSLSVSLTLSLSPQIFSVNARRTDLLVGDRVQGLGANSDNAVARNHSSRCCGAILVHLGNINPAVVCEGVEDRRVQCELCAGESEGGLRCDHDGAHRGQGCGFANGDSVGKLFCNA